MIKIFRNVRQQMKIDLILVADIWLHFYFIQRWKKGIISIRSLPVLGSLHLMFSLNCCCCRCQHNRLSAAEAGFAKKRLKWKAQKWHSLFLYERRSLFLYERSSLFLYERSSLFLFSLSLVWYIGWRSYSSFVPSVRLFIMADEEGELK